MNWLIEEQEGIVILKMSSNKLNLMNDAFFKDLNYAFDTLDKEYANKPVVLTSVGNVFSAGLDLNQCYEIFAGGNTDEVLSWFNQFRDSMLRVFNFNRPIVAALNGHAIAGGLILALCCDTRYAVSTNAKFGLNEVTIGFPLPSVFAEIIKYALGARRSEEILFNGMLYNPDDCIKLGIFHDITDHNNLIDMSVAYAGQFNSDNMYSYSIAKKSLRAEANHRIEAYCNDIDKDVPRMLTSDKTKSNLKLILENLKDRK